MPRTRAPRIERLEELLMLNASPIAKDDLAYSTPQDTALVVTSANSLLNNDWDPEGSSLTASVVANPASGTISNFSGSAGTFTYTPNSGFNGLDSFTYKVSDGTSDSATVTVALAVGGHLGARTNLDEQPRDDFAFSVLDFGAGDPATTLDVRGTSRMLYSGGLELALPLTRQGQAASGLHANFPGLVHPPAS